MIHRGSIGAAERQATGTSMPFRGVFCRAGPSKDRLDVTRSALRLSPLALLAVCLAWVGVAVVLSGCRSRGTFRADPSRPFEEIATQIEYPAVADAPGGELLGTPPPHTVRQPEEPDTWPMTLDEAIHLALANNEVIRDAGGRVVRAPETVPTVYDPAIAETDPRFGPEAALSAFDAQFTTGILWEKNDRAVNNILLGGLTGPLAFGFQQDRAVFQAEMSKQTAAGTEYSLRNTTNYDKNNLLFNLNDAVYDTVFTAELRHPLLQGAGIEFNRIAGPLARPGQYGGVVLARIGTDVSLADFEAAVVDLLIQVERTYWQLYFAYRDLEAKKSARDAALETWRSVSRRYEVGDADAEQEALTRQQYYLFQSQVIDALGGREGGAEAILAGGVYATERELRSLVGLPPSDGRVIRPADEPSSADTIFNWRATLAEALWRRVELRRQLWLVKRRELELTAAKNFLHMRLDFVGQYRWRGLGEQLLGDESAFEQLFEGDFQEWQLGLQLNTPVGNRIGHTAVRNAELQLARERARHREIERQVVDDVSGAFAELERAYEIARVSFNRGDASRRQLEEIRKKYEGGWVPLQFVLDAQARAVEADGVFYRSLVDYTLAVAELHRSRGTLLDYYEVYLAEGPWSPAGYLSAKKQARRFAPKLLDYSFTSPPPVSLGLHPQQALGSPDSESGEEPLGGDRVLVPGESLPDPIPPPLPLSPDSS